MLELADIQQAAERVRGQVLDTPCVESRTLSQLTGTQLFLKMENLQFTASFKERGACNKLAQLTDQEKARGVIAMSAGNHAQGVAYHAERLGIPATIVMPSFTPGVKVARTRGFGARVILHGDSLEAAYQHARTLAEAQNLVFVHPYDDLAIMAGQGTLALEMLAAQPELDTLVVPVGGGGLISGIATAAKALRPGIRVIGVQTQRYPAMVNAVQGTRHAQGGNTIAEGIAAWTTCCWWTKATSSKPSCCCWRSKRPWPKVRARRRWRPCCATANALPAARSAWCCRAATSTRSCWRRSSAAGWCVRGG